MIFSSQLRTIDMIPEEITKLRRRIEDYLRKYATVEQLVQIAGILGIKIK